MYVFEYGTMRPDLYPHRHMLGRPCSLPSSGWAMWNIGGKFPVLVPVTNNKHSPLSRARFITGQLLETNDCSELDRYMGYRTREGALFIRSEAVIKDPREVVRSAFVYYLLEEQLQKLAERATIRPCWTGDWADEMGG